MGTFDGEVVEGVGLNLSDSDAVFIVEECFNGRARSARHIEPTLEGDDHHRVAKREN